jgi:hypothetical protein
MKYELRNAKCEADDPGFALRILFLISFPGLLARSSLSLPISHFSNA